MVKTRGGFDCGMTSSHTPSTRRCSTRSFASKQGQKGFVDPDVSLAVKPSNIVVPPKFQLSSEDSSSSEELSASVQNLEQVAIEEIEIKEKSTPTETLVPVQKTYTGESSKIKNLPIQKEMVAMLASVHKLIDEITEKTTPLPSSVSPLTDTTSSQPNVASLVRLSSLI